MQSSSETKIDSNEKKMGYEQWLEKSLTLFKEEIHKVEPHFDEKDHTTASAHNQSIYQSLHSINDALFKFFTIYGLVTTIMSHINTKETLHSSGIALSKKIKTCLIDLLKIDITHKKNAKENSKWFYELIEEYRVHRLIDPLIKKLDMQINHHSAVADQPPQAQERPVLHI